MPIDVDGAPRPKAHIKTLMKIGYDFCTAISDIIDNSVSAKSTTIKIFSLPGRSSPFISIVDDGHGMTEDELISNMVIGCKDPSLQRQAQDQSRLECIVLKDPPKNAGGKPAFLGLMVLGRLRADDFFYDPCSI